jgi:hypothetical protein
LVALTAGGGETAVPIGPERWVGPSAVTAATSDDRRTVSSVPAEASPSETSRRTV